MMSQQISNDSSSSECIPQVLDHLKHLTVVEPQDSVVHAPIVSSFNDRIRPLLDCVDNLRNLGSMQEDIKLPTALKLGHLGIMQDDLHLPTIVVIGNQSSGKSSVVGSLAGISLPRGEGICTRVPLIMRLQNHSETKVYLEYNGKSVPTDEVHIEEAIILATNEIAGLGKGISNIPLTLVVKKNGVPDLTMVDLPGIPTVPVHGISDDTSEQISETIMKYITPEDSIILNVVSATDDFPTCDCIKMSKKVDKSGVRTLVVVTKVDKAPEGLLEKVTLNDVNIGLGYVCVKNRIANESSEEALSKEARLFETHALLSKIDKSIVGVPVLAHKLVQTQTNIIFSCSLDILRKINAKLAVNVATLNEFPQTSVSVAEALATFMCIHSLATVSLMKIFLREIFDKYTKDLEMQCAVKWSELLDLEMQCAAKWSEMVDLEIQCTAKWAELVDLELKQYSAEVRSKYAGKKESLKDEFVFLKEAQSTGLPLSEKEFGLSNFPLRTVFLDVLQKKVRGFSAAMEEFVAKLWNYIEGIVIEVFMYHSSSYPELQYIIRSAVQKLIARRKDELIDEVQEIIGMNKLTDLPSNREYVATFSRLMAQQKRFMKFCKSCKRGTKVNVQGFGEIDVLFLRKQPKDLVQLAFQLKMTMAAYWKTMLGNEIDAGIVNEHMASLDMRLTAFCYFTLGLNKFVDEIEDEILGDLIASHGGGVESSLQESLTVEKCFMLKKNVKLLEELKEVAEKIMDILGHHVSSGKA